MDIGKIPPHDVEAEQAVIGSMLTDKEAVASSIEVLKEEDFYREDNRIIYSAMLNLYNRAEPIDLITLKSELESMGKFEQVGGFEYLAELPEKVPTTANATKYIKIPKFGISIFSSIPVFIILIYRKIFSGFSRSACFIMMPQTIGIEIHVIAV